MNNNSRRIILCFHRGRWIIPIEVSPNQKSKHDRGEKLKKWNLSGMKINKSQVTLTNATRICRPCVRGRSTMPLSSNSTAPAGNESVEWGKMRGGRFIRCEIRFRRASVALTVAKGTSLFTMNGRNERVQVSIRHGLRLRTAEARLLDMKRRYRSPDRPRYL